MIIFHKLEKGEDPIQVQLVYANFWVQVHDLPPSFMLKGMARQLGNFFGEFLDYDTMIISKGIKKFMHIKVKIDVQQPLKRRKRIIYGRDKITFVLFKYEKLSLFCFLCGRLGHGESFYSLRLIQGV